MRGVHVVAVPLAGALHVRTGAEDTALVSYRLVDPRLAGRRLTFVTEPVDGVSFDFDGSFVQFGKLSELQPTGVVLTGRLRRLEHGRVAAELDARFTYFVGD